MRGSIERAALILAVGIVASAVILTGGIWTSTKALGEAVKRAGSSARSSVSVPPFPRELDIRLEDEKEVAAMNSDDRERLVGAFVDALKGTEVDGVTIESVTVDRFALSSRGGMIEGHGDIVFSDGTKEEDFRAWLSPDGFGAYMGLVRDKKNSRLLADDIRIE